MKTIDIKNDQIYWTFLRVIEAYEAFNEAPPEPRCVKAKWSPRGGSDQPVLTLHGFDPDTGEINTDSNATAYPASFNGETRDVFLDEITAQKAYRQESLKYAKKRISEAKYILDELPETIMEIEYLREMSKYFNNKLQLAEKAADNKSSLKK